MEDNLRYFVLTPGRSGSSILSAILADAGADFGMTAPADWNRDGGSLEHPLIVKAAKTEAVTLAAHPTAPLFSMAKLDWKIRRYRVKRMVARALESATYFKAGDLQRLVGPATKLGYEIRPIISLRSFDNLAPSMLRWPGGFRSFSGIEQVYVSTYANALSLMYVNGGTYVDYDELMDPRQTAWAGRLANATGLDAEALVESRNARVSDKRLWRPFPIKSERAEAVYNAIVGFEETSNVVSLTN